MFFQFSGEVIFGGACYWTEFFVSKLVGLLLGGGGGYYGVLLYVVLKFVFRLQDILQSLESHHTQIEQAISQGKDLMQMDGALDLVHSNVTRLETLWSEVCRDCKLREEELEMALNNWSRYNEALEGFKEVLAEGEVEVTRRKALHVSGIEVVNEQKQEIQVWQTIMDI